MERVKRPPLYLTPPLTCSPKYALGQPPSTTSSRHPWVRSFPKISSVAQVALVDIVAPVAAAANQVAPVALVALVAAAACRVAPVALVALAATATFGAAPVAIV